jgi:hypothetical protein
MNNEDKKYCSRCKAWKDASLFIETGWVNLCKTCRSDYYREWYKRNKQRKYAQDKKWHEENKERHTEQQRNWRKNNPERVHELARRYRERHPTRIRARARKYYKTHAEERRQYSRRHYSENRDVCCAAQREHRKLPEVKAKLAEYQRNRCEIDNGFKIAKNLRSRINTALRRQRGGTKASKNTSTTRSLGCAIPELVSHLESLFQEGMSWENYGRGSGKWHVDHVVPLTAFDLENEEDFAKACHYTNLQPLWAHENISKGGA